MDFKFKWILNLIGNLSQVGIRFSWYLSSGGGSIIKKSEVLLVLFLLVLLFVSSFAGNIKGKYESVTHENVTPAKNESPVYMKFKMEILTTLIVSFFLIFALSRYTLRGNREERKNIIEETEHGFSNIMEDPVISAVTRSKEYLIDPITSTQTQASVIGKVNNGYSEMIPSISSLRSNKMNSISMGNESSIKDIFYPLETIDEDGEPIEKSLASTGDENYAPYMKGKVSPAQQFEIQSSILEGNYKFIGMQAFVFKDKVGSDCVIDQKTSLNDVTIHGVKSRSPSEVITSQAKTDKSTGIPEDCQYNATKKPK
jgi:carbonic anhydrase/acetyltransferase-like protein (isoleucine patch superfamily)